MIFVDFDEHDLISFSLTKHPIDDNRHINHYGYMDQLSFEEELVDWISVFSDDHFWKKLILYCWNFIRHIKETGDDFFSGWRIKRSVLFLWWPAFTTWLNPDNKKKVRNVVYISSTIKISKVTIIVEGQRSTMTTYRMLLPL